MSRIRNRLESPRSAGIPALILAATLAVLTGCREDKPAVQAQTAQVPKIALDTLSSRIKMGESFNSIARNLGLPVQEASLLLAGIKDNFRFKLYAGQSYKVIFDRTSGDRSFHSFILEDRYSDRKHVLSRPAESGAPALSAASVSTPASTSTGILPAASAAAASRGRYLSSRSKAGLSSR